MSRLDALSRVRRLVPNRARECTVADLTEDDHGYTVVFTRPPSESSGWPRVCGQLVAVIRHDYLQGLMPRRGYRLRMYFRRGNLFETSGVMAAHHRVRVVQPRSRSRRSDT